LVVCASGGAIERRLARRQAIAGCALDVTDPEPLPNPHPVRNRDNVIITPHVA
jgi:D-3-phosphoglycerate dehydrogenase